MIGKTHNPTLPPNERCCQVLKQGFRQQHLLSTSKCATFGDGLKPWPELLRLTLNVSTRKKAALPAFVQKREANPTLHEERLHWPETLITFFLKQDHPLWLFSCFLHLFRRICLSRLAVFPKFWEEPTIVQFVFLSFMHVSAYRPYAHALSLQRLGESEEDQGSSRILCQPGISRTNNCFRPASHLQLADAKRVSRGDSSLYPIGGRMPSCWNRPRSS